METVSPIIEIAKVIAEVGIMVVLSALMIIIFLRLFRNQERLIKDLQEEVKNNRQSCNSPQEHPDDEDLEMLELINSKIHTELSLLLQSLSSDRAYIYLYHNGGISSSGLFFQRMSCISEVVSAGVLPVSQQSQNLHRSSYTRVLSIIQEKGEWHSEDVHRLQCSDGFLYQRFKSTHTESVYVRALVGSQGHVIGFVGVDYCSINEDVDYETIHRALKKTSSVIATLVDIRGEVSGQVEENSK